MAGTIVADIIQSDQSYASSINIASPMIVSNTISMTNGAISGNVNFDSGTLFVNTLVDRVSVGKTTNLAGKFEVAAGTNEQFFVGSGRKVGWLNDAGSSWVDSQWNGLSHTFNVGQYASIGSMVIDSSGRVTKPYQPVFYAYGAQTVTVPDAKYTAPSTYINNGSYYNTSTGRFTAPVAGYYIFGGMLRLDAAMSYLYFDPKVNGTRLYNSLSTLPGLTGFGGFSGSITPTGFAGGTTSFILALNANDYVEMNIGANYSGSVGVNPQTYWYGYLLG